MKAKAVEMIAEETVIVDINDSPLGKRIESLTAYDPSILFSIPRKPMREELGIMGSNPFFGMDFWNGYELSWLNLRGKPQVGILRFSVSSDSKNIVESKSLKLYLNGFSQHRIEKEDLIPLISKDLSDAFDALVMVSIIQPDEFDQLKIEEMDGLLLDRLDISTDIYAPAPELLRSNLEEAPVEEVLFSHLLRTNCPVTGQPDWATLQIHYAGPQIDQERLLKYIISLRTTQAFHEQCVERIWLDIRQYCRPSHLSVYARYTRRGGIDINPWRTNFTTRRQPQVARTARQ
ncbi:MAG: NADPH-dependent 7-cyano-7-deazaguanine reductase QueF [Oxalobacter sp.]